MKRMQWVLLCTAAFGLGWACGRFEWPRSTAAEAQLTKNKAAVAELGLAPETVDKLEEAWVAIKTAREALEQDGKYVAATKGTNVFAVTVGGLNAMEDLEKGRGVDPETFAALYAGLATDQVAAHLDRDEQGRLRYKNRVVRMYSIERLKKLFERRQTFSREEY
ncbi:MAG: hypothetical protein D6725_10970 [Planctomycetota bacterium]|nr:MAG: hypothetical protein D6725_10970 [Planctomycetota bacterium]